MGTRRALKSAAAYALQRTGTSRLVVTARRFAAGGRRVVILGYHRVGEDFETARTGTIESCVISRATFRRHVEYLAGHFELATMSRAVEVLSGRERASRDIAAITFDDGYRDVLEHALPVLRDARAPATIYVPTGAIDSGTFLQHDRLYTLLCAWDANALVRQRLVADAAAMVERARAAARGGDVRLWLHYLIERHGYDELEALAASLAAAAPADLAPPRSASLLDWDGVRELAAGGFELGAHTVSHCVLTHFDRDRADREIRACQEMLEARIGGPARHFAYCNGYYNDTVIDLLRQRGFVSGVTTEDRLNHVGDDPFRIARRCLWEGSTRGLGDRVSESLVACQLDDVWSALGFDASESGRRPEPRTGLASAIERRLA